jgi:alpha-ketoglutarate-dependent taurine dioxygenase
MLSRTGHDPRAWCAATVDDRSTWHYPLSPVCLDILNQALRELRDRPRPATACRLPEEQATVCARELRPVLQALEQGRGFAILTGLPRERCSSEEAQALYWLIGQALGRPLEQNVQGTLLYDVRDTGQEVAYGARFSVTRAESTFHTDNSFGQEILDFVGLLCLNAAREGGQNQLLSAYTVHKELLAHHRAALDTLSRPFHFDRRGGVRPGESPTAQFPILSWDGETLTVRYLRYWIETAHEKVGQPLTPAQQSALQTLDEVLGRRTLQVEFHLQPGEMLFVNNRWILHNRTAFVDHPEPQRRRHYIRLWLQAQAPPAGS